MYRRRAYFPLSVLLFLWRRSSSTSQLAQQRYTIASISKAEVVRSSMAGKRKGFFLVSFRKMGHFPSAGWHRHCRGDSYSPLAVASQRRIKEATIAIQDQCTFQVLSSYGVFTGPPSMLDRLARISKFQFERTWILRVADSGRNISLNNIQSGYTYKVYLYNELLTVESKLGPLAGVCVFSKSIEKTFIALRESQCRCDGSRGRSVLLLSPRVGSRSLISLSMN